MSDTHTIYQLPAALILAKLSQRMPDAGKTVLELAERVQALVHLAEDRDVQQQARLKPADIINGFKSIFGLKAAVARTKQGDIAQDWWHVGHCMRVAILAVMHNRNIKPTDIGLTKNDCDDLDAHGSQLCFGNSRFAAVLADLKLTNATTPKPS